MSAKRPMQIQVEEADYLTLKVYAASRDMTANELVAELAGKEAQRLRDEVKAVSM